MWLGQIVRFFETKSFSDIAFYSSYILTTDRKNSTTLELELKASFKFGFAGRGGGGGRF